MTFHLINFAHPLSHYDMWSRILHPNVAGATIQLGLNAWDTIASLYPLASECVAGKYFIPKLPMYSDKNKLPLE